MCGIYFSVCSPNCRRKPEDQDPTGLQQCMRLLKRRGPDLQANLEIVLFSHCAASLCGCVLWLQGAVPTRQPARDHKGNTLLWNGDIFNLESTHSTRSDTLILLEKLGNCQDANRIGVVMSQIQGPWAFVYHSRQLDCIFFGRDRFGRHSLLWNLAEDIDISDKPLGVSGEVFTLSSVPVPQISVSVEVPATGVFRLLTRDDRFFIDQILTWPEYHINKDIPQLESGTVETDNAISNYINNFVKELEIFEEILLSSVRVRLECQPLLCKGCVSHQLNDLEESVICKHAKTAILFSGGLDSAVIAALADKCLPPDESIDLLNVAFEQKLKNGKKLETGHYDVPDRATGLQALAELRRMNPHRKWNFVEVNVPIEELVAVRTNSISPLIFPLVTVLDDSIGCAQWFAARGKGTLRTDQGTSVEYTSPARVILMGAGADEQLGGYARHRQRFQQGGWSSLCQELEMEMRRISHRNLGRDNRVISDHGRALRLPYLDERVVSFLSSLPIHCKADLRYKPGVGDKILLRSLARRLGLESTALEAKRAIQFGSRIAKAEGRNEKGSDVCTRLHAK